MGEVLTIDCATGETTTRPHTPEEQAAIDAANAAAETQRVTDQWQAVRDTRGVALTQTDWIVAPPADTPPPTLDEIAAHQQGWNDYRQALRDLTNDTTADPDKLVWPTPPPAPETTIPDAPEFALTTNSYPYDFATNNAPPPGNQQIRLNDYSMAAAGAAYIDGTTAEGADVQAALAATPNDATLTIRSNNNPDAYGSYRVTATIDHDTWVEFALVALTVGTKIQTGGCTLAVVS